MVETRKPAEELIFEQLENLLNIGIALSAEKDLTRLLEMIVTEARRITNADAGTLYLKQSASLIFRIIQNQSLNISQGGCGELDLPPVPLKKENVSAFVALTGSTVNIADVYEAEGFDFNGPRNYDNMTGYRTKSMLVVPIKNQEGDVLGVLQLINALSKAGQRVVTFAPYYQKVVESLASQAGVAMTNAQLLQDIENLFNSFVQVMAAAIDSRTPYNANHSRRVALLAKSIVGAINREKQGPFGEINFSSDKQEQLVMAGWLHDIGKLATPLSVMNKATRLGDKLDLVMQRFAYIHSTEENRSLQRQVELLLEGKIDLAQQEAKRVQENLLKIEAARELILQINNPSTFVNDGLCQEIQEIAVREWWDAEDQGCKKPYLTQGEIKCLMVRAGTLTGEERVIMEEHVQITTRLLDKMPFIKKFEEVPVFASMHHEHLDGKGYPGGLKGDQIPLEARILALVDVYDALTAGDRPYKKAMLVEDALRVLGYMVKDGKVDGDLYELFIKHRVWESVDA